MVSCSKTPYITCVRIILKYNADPNHRYFNPPLMIQIAERNHDSPKFITVCDALLNGIRPINLNATNDNGETAPLKAPWCGNLGLVQWLLANGADPNVLDSSNKFALSRAIGLNSLNVVATLLHSGARIDVAHNAGEGPLIFFALSNPEIVRLLVDYGADINPPARSNNVAPIYIALA